jgi:outer membrane protein assembly factor BamD
LKPIRLLLPCLIILLSGCSTDKVDPYLGDAPSYIYAKGHTALQTGDNTDALSAYQSLDSQYPFNPYTQKGDIESIYAYYQNDNPAMSITAASRYLKIYPNDPHADYAYYMMGIVDFENGRGFLQKYFPYDMAQHNADNYTTAFNYFNTLVQEYPKSPYASDARRRMIYLNNTLAQYQLNVAENYYKRGAYVAAINRAQSILIQFPTTPQNEQALAIIMQSQQQLGLTELAASTASVLKYNYPNDPALHPKQ